MALTYGQLFGNAQDGRQMPNGAMPTPTPIQPTEKRKNYEPTQTATPPASKPSPFVKVAQQTANALNQTAAKMVTKNLPETAQQPMQQQMVQSMQQNQQAQTAAPQQPAAQAPASEPQAQTFAPSDNAELIQYLQEQADAEKAKMETPEQRAKRERREKWSAAISGIGDAASSIANLIFTTKYAPNMYNPQNSLSAATQARIDKAKAERDKVRDNYINYALKIGQLKDNDREWQYKQQKAADEKAQREFENKLKLAKEERDNAITALNLQLTAGKIDEQTWKTKSAEAEAKYADDKAKAEVDATKARATASRASATASYANARNANARTAKVYHDMAAEGNGRKKFATGASVKQRNWDNDDYIEQLYSQIRQQSSYKGSDGKTHVISAGTRDLFQSTDDRMEGQTDRSSRINMMRGAIEELLTNNYDEGAQAAIGAVMEDFDERYSPKKR